MEITLNGKDIKKKKQEEREKRLRDLWEGENDKTAVERVVKDNWDDDDNEDDDDEHDAGGHIPNNNEESMKKDKEISTLEVKLQVVGKEKSVDKEPNMKKRILNEDDYLKDKIKKVSGQNAARLVSVQDEVKQVPGQDVDKLVSRQDAIKLVSGEDVTKMVPIEDVTKLVPVENVDEEVNNIYVNVDDDDEDNVIYEDEDDESWFLPRKLFFFQS